MFTRSQIVKSLRSRVQALEATCHPQGACVTSGSRSLDRLLGTGFERGTLVEWLGATGSGATSLALVAAREACGEQGTLVVVDDQRRFYPPAARALGIDLARTIVLQPQNTRDYCWSMAQTLRCGGVAAVVCWPDKIGQRVLRRWQLAAEQGRGLGFLVRPCRTRHAPTWSKIRLLVEAVSSQTPARRCRITIVGAHPRNGRSLELEMDHETGRLGEASALSVVAPLDAATRLQSSSGA